MQEKHNDPDSTDLFHRALSENETLCPNLLLYQKWDPYEKVATT
jgi:hypothetical protein